MHSCALVLATVLQLGAAESDALARIHARDLTPLAATNVCVTADAPPLALIADGGCTLPIVFEDEERATFAAGYLAMALEEMTGREVTQYRLPLGLTNTFAKSIFVPRPSEGDAFTVAISADGVRFSGRSDFAAYDFCERVLGVRHYWDGPAGHSVPKADRLVLPALVYRDAPVFAFRRYSAHGNPIWLRVAKGGGTFDRWCRCHTTDDGFCYGSPEGFAEYCRRVDADIAGGEKFVRVVDRDRKTVSVSPWDVYYDCKCMWCRTLKRNLGNVTGDASTILWERFLPRLVRHMAERHPDWRVSVLPYWNCVMPPKAGTDLGTNVQAEVCSMSGLAAFKWDRVREREEGIILDWERATGRKVANWHYSCWPAEYTTAPYVYGHTIADHYRRMREHIVGSFICGGKDDFPRFLLSMYVWMRCLWNPELDVEAVYDTFCERQFGTAAKPMRELIRIQEEEWDPTILHFSYESLRRMAELLNESTELVRGTSAATAFANYASGFFAAFGVAH